jgi:serine/threonine protein kinase/WD40 repeat protein
MKRDDDLFADALDMPAAERAGFLAQACRDDPAQRARIEELLRGHAFAPVYLNAPVAPLAPDEQAGDKIAGYVLAEKIGEGGCGVVWHAEQQRPVQRAVALKIIKLGMDTREVITRFEVERQTLAMMEHPNIAQIFDAGTTHTGRPYFVMELVRGAPITRYCDEAGLPTAGRLRLFIAVCHAIQHAHQKGIIHRDIKPSNVLVAELERQPIPKVIDFGIAKATQGRLVDATLLTAAEQFMGTPAYMSPEQAGGNPAEIDTRSDIYSLGVLLYELLTGDTPFDRKSRSGSGPDEIRRHIRTVEPMRPSTRASRSRGATAGIAPAANEIRGDLDWIVMKALEKEPARRYESASALAADIQRHLAHEPVTARPPSRVYLLRKMVRRHRVAFVAAAAIAVIFVAGAAVSAWQAVRATHAEHAQGRLRERAETSELAARRRAYASDINAVQLALANDNIGRAQELLDRHRPKPGELDLRGWEWRYLWQLCRSEAVGTLPSQTQVLSLAVSHDGKWLVTGSVLPPAIELWNLDTPSAARVPQRLASEYSRVFFAPQAPLLVMSEGTPVPRPDFRLKLLNVTTGQTVGEWPVSSLLLNAFFSPDGELLLTHHRSEVVLWRTPTGERVRAFPVAGGATITAAKALDVFVAEGAGAQGSIRLVDVATGENRWIAKVAAEHSIGLAFSADGKIVASAAAGAESVIRLWDAATGAALGELEGHRAYCRRLLFTSDSKTLVSAGMDQTIRVWDVATKRLIRTLRGHQQGVMDLSLLSDGSLVSAAADRTVRFWDLRAARAPGSTSRISGRVLAWSFTPDSQGVVTVDPALNIRRWHGRDFQQPTPLPSPGGSIRPTGKNGLSLSADASLLAMARGDGVVEVWNFHEEKSLGRIETRGRVVLPVAILQQGRKLLVNDESEETSRRGLYEWDIATRTQLRAWPRESPRCEYIVSPDESLCIVRTTEGPRGFPNDGPIVAPERGPRWAIDLRTGAQRTLENVRLGLSAAAFSPDGRLLATPLVDRAMVWDTKTFAPVITLGGGILGMHGAAFTPDGRRLAITTTSVEAVRLWDVQNWEPLLTLDAPGSLFSRTAFSPDGNVLGSVTQFGQLHLWRAPSWSEIVAIERGPGVGAGSR